MPATVRDSSVYPIHLREFDVVEVSDVTPGMRRIVVGGPAMDAHIRDGIDIPPVHTHGFDDDIKILPPDPSGGFPFDLPRNTDTGAIDWPPGSFEYSRTYTVRRFDAEARLMTIDFALHPGGIAADWARSATAGDHVLIAGPKYSAGLPSGVDWMLLAGDETALPAIAHCLEKLPPTMPASVVIEVAEPDHRQELECAAPVDVTWLFRNDVGGDSRLVTEVQRLPWRPGQPYLWIAGETLTIKPLRRWAKQDKKIDKRYVEITGYWRHRDVAVGTSPDAPSPEALVHEMGELLPPIALRAAVTLGIFGSIESGCDRIDRLAQECRAHPVALAKLLRHLVVTDLLTVNDGRYALTEMGAVLADPDTFASQALHWDGIHSRLDSAFFGLLDAVRYGSAVPFSGRGFREWMANNDFADGVHAEAVLAATYRAPALADAVDLASVSSVAIVGEGSGVYADVLARLYPDMTPSVVGLPSANDRCLADVSADRSIRVNRIDAGVFAALPVPVDLVVVAEVVDTLPDADARLLLSAMAASASRVVLVTDLLDPATTDDHETEDDLRRLCLYGAGRRTESEVTELAGAAGCSVIRSGSLGWGATVIEVGRDMNGLRA